MISSSSLTKIKFLLKRDYPNILTPLLHRSARELLIATVLSAQTLDSTVNKVTPNLFEKFPDLLSLANAEYQEVDDLIKIVNYHKTKSRNIIKLAQYLLDNHDGIIPSSINELSKIPGVGRKTANVLINEWFTKKLDKRGNPTMIDLEFQTGEDFIKSAEGFVVDTHVLRTAKRLGLTEKDDPLGVELDLMKLFDQSEWGEISLKLIFHGRYRCKSRNPLCYLDEEWSKICSCVKEKIK